MITVTTSYPQNLVEKINAFIRVKRTTEWELDEENDYVLNLPDLKYKAWMTVNEDYSDGKLRIGIIESTKYRLTKRIYSMYHCRFAEFVLEYFDNDISNIEISSLLVPDIDKFKIDGINESKDRT